MIEITKGNPTSEEIAALVAALMLASGTHPTAPHRLRGGPVATSQRRSPKSIRCAEPA